MPLVGFFLPYYVDSRYGFYGEVIRESENYRWMGPARYDFSGTMVFLKHR
jgi:ceramide kinase